MIVRPATTADIPAIAAVLEAVDESAAWPGLPGWPYLEHLTSRGRVPVADVDGAIVGMAGSIEVGGPGVRFLTDLFVHPDHRDHGVGHALFMAAVEGARERLTFSSDDPRALGSYLRAGLRPWWPLLYLAVPRAALEPRTPPRTVVAEPADPDEAADWSRRWTGMDRSLDFAHYASLPDGAGQVIRQDGAVAAVAFANRTRAGEWRALDHVSIAPDADAVAVTLVAMGAALAAAPGLVVSIPGPHPAVPTLLERGARITDRDQYCSTDPALLDPERILPSPGFL